MVSNLSYYVRRPSSTCPLLRLKYGCTCGDCLGGFISPRMKSILVQKAELIYDELYGSLEDADERNFDVLRYTRYTTPGALLSERPLWSDYIDIFMHIASCLRSNKVPMSENVVATLPRDATRKEHLILNGTSEVKIEPVLQILLEEAKAGSKKAGNGTLEQHGIIPHELKECRNDYEFGVMELGCGLQPHRTFPL